jgi:NAD(P)-dependent dehydrogenase (short-subunit alcohol dehydrogenase family)
MKLEAGIAAIVTGGTSGLGAATARRLALHGVRVALFGRNGAQGSVLAQQIGGIFCPADVTSDAELDAAFALARAAHGQERVLINCAGVGSAQRTVQRDKASGRVITFPMEEFVRVVEINLMGTFRCITRAAAGMLTLEPLPGGERGVIINTSSIAAEDGKIGHAAYSASKAAITGMTLPLARDLMGEGIRVNTIMPGLFDTPMMQQLPVNLRAVLAASVPFPPRLGNPEEFADLAELIVRNAYLNGTCLRLDGGMRMSAR